MKYLAEFSMLAIDQMKQMDRHTATIILSWVRNYIDSKEPRRQGCSVVGGYGWKYNIGTYRLLAEIRDKDKAVLILWIGKLADE